MDFSTASKYAVQIVNWLSPYCHRLEIAGSIRRNRPQCADIDIVCIPKITEEKDMLGTVIGRANHCLQFLQSYVGDDVRRLKPSGARFISGGEREGKQVILQLPKCQLDLWFADAATFENRLLLRTGSKEHNAWLATRAQDYGLHWFIYYGFVRDTNVTSGMTGEQALDDGLLLPVNSEADIYRHVGLDFIPPEYRQIDWLTKNINSGFPI
jgi:DNA polymerase/3'-5' exonuclease PolX